MNILVIGETKNTDEVRLKFGDGHLYLSAESQLEGRKLFHKSDVVFDLIIDEDPTQIEVYRDQSALPFFLNVPATSLKTLVAPIDGEINCTLFGFNGLPTFLNRPVLEASLHRKEDYKRLEDICQKLKTEFLVVDDRVGMVTPRVICMIINEAYYTVEDGTATREDIDLAMKLGTNYPYGPFEWAKRIGVKNVCELLEAVYNDTNDQRYRICPMLMDESRAVGRY